MWIAHDTNIGSLWWLAYLVNLDAVTRKSFMKLLFLKLSQYSEENTSVGVFR